MAALCATGNSSSWNAAKTNVLRILNLFIAQDDELDGDWDSLPEDVLCAKQFYERLAYFLLHEYKIPGGAKNAGLPLDGDTPMTYLNVAVNQAANKFRAAGTDATKGFFNCLDQKSTSQEAIWLRGLRANMKRAIFERAALAGAEMDKSEGASLGFGVVSMCLTPTLTPPPALRTWTNGP
jgi:hypothetical protein